MRTKISALALCVAVGLPGLTSAQTPRPNVFDGGNRWLITGYFDNSPVHQGAATQCICFLPYANNAPQTHISGAWYSCSYPGWRGRYAQEGDRVLMHGEWANGNGHDSMVIELFAGNPDRQEGSGQWTEWLENGTYGTTIAFGNNRLLRAGKCEGLPGTAAAASQADIEKRSVEFSNRVKPRLRKDGKPAESPMDPNQVPLPPSR